MAEQILYVDDDPNILASCKRSLGRRLNITTAQSGAEGLQILKMDSSFAVVLSDMRMPGMDGIEFICQARKLLPHTTFMMLTGNSDQGTAMDAVNRGQIFRFLTKPCPQEVLHDALKAGIRQHQLVTAERELLQNTLTGSIKTLIEILELVSPEAFSRGARIKPIVKAVVAELCLECSWQYEIAAMLSQIGCLILPQETIEKVYAGKKLFGHELEMYLSHPESGGKMLEHIPRLEPCVQMIVRQRDPFDSWHVSDSSQGADAAVLGAQLLHVASDFELYLTQGVGRVVALSKMRSNEGQYNPRLLSVLETVSIPGIDVTASGTLEELTVFQLASGMYAQEDILTTTGNLLVSKGTEMTRPLIERLKNFTHGVGVQEPVKVLVPRPSVAGAA